MSKFRVALSADFRKGDGSPSFPEFDLSPLQDHPDIDMVYLGAGTGDLRLAAHRCRCADPAHPAGGYREPDPERAPGDGGAVRRRLRQRGPRSVQRPRRRGGHHARRRAAAGRSVHPDLHLRPRRQALRQGRPRPPRTGRLGPRRPCTTASASWGSRSDRSAWATSGPRCSVSPVRSTCASSPTTPTPDPALAAELGVTLTDLDSVFRESDFVCVNCPLSEETHHLVNRKRLALMKPTAFLVNTARGPIVDQAALTEVLRERGIAGAGIDVFEREPPHADDPLLALDNVIVTPHALCWTDQLFSGSGAADVGAVLAVMAGNVPKGIVNREVIDRPRLVRRASRTTRRNSPPAERPHFFRDPTCKSPPPGTDFRRPAGDSRCRCLAVSYFHMGRPHTIVGAERLHYRVRDGVGWFPLAIATKQDRNSESRSDRFRVRQHPLQQPAWPANRLGVAWSSLTGN